MLGKIIIYDQYIFTLIHEILCKSSTSIRSNILKRCTVAGCCGEYGCILHCTVFFKIGNYLCNGRSFLSDGNIDTDHILTFLVDDRIGCDGCFTCLSVADDQLSLSTADREHGINGKDSCFQRYSYRLTVDDSRSRVLDRAVFLCLDLSLSINRLTKCVHDSSDKFIPYRNTCLLTSSGNLGAFLDSCILSEKNTSHAVGTDILYHTFQTILEGHDLTVHGMIDAINSCDTISHGDDSAYFLVLADFVIVLYFFLENRNDFIWIYCTQFNFTSGLISVSVSYNVR